MRVAYVCADPGVPVFGTKGASVHVQEVLRVLVAAGARVDLFCTRVGGPRPAGLDAVTLHALPVPRHGDPAARERGALAADRTLGQALDCAGPYDLVYERYSLWGRAGTRYAAAHGVPCVVEVNAPLLDEHARHRTLVHRPEAQAVLHDVIRAAASLVAVSDPVAEWLRGHGADPARVHVVPNGVDTERFRPPTVEPDGPFTVGFVGSLKPWHGVEVLLAAVPLLREQVPDARLLVVGDGPLTGAVQAATGTPGLAGAVHLTGAVPAGEVPGLLATVHAAVAPYPPGAETYFSPLKVFEYLAAGRPVVASRVGQLPALLQDGVDGILVEAGDAEALAGALVALAADPDRRRRMGEAARRRAVTGHTWRSVVDRSLATAGVPLPGGSPQVVAAAAGAVS